MTKAVLATMVTTNVLESRKTILVIARMANTYMNWSVAVLWAATRPFFDPDLNEVQRLGKNNAYRLTGDKLVYRFVNISVWTGAGVRQC